MSTTALNEPDWHALEDGLAPICAELASRFAGEYDVPRRQAAYDAALEDIRRRDAQALAAQLAAGQVATQQAWDDARRDNPSTAEEVEAAAVAQLEALMAERGVTLDA